MSDLNYSMDEIGGLIEAGASDEAIRGLQRILRTMPASFLAHLKLGQAYVKKSGGTDKAMLAFAAREFSEALRLVPPDEGSHLAVIELGRSLGRADQLRAEYQGRLSNLPGARALLEQVDRPTPKPARLLADWKDSIAATLGGNGLALAFIAVAAVLVVGLIWKLSKPVFDKRPADQAPAAALPPAQQAAAFSLSNLSGRTVSLKEFAGKSVVILDFWATWCGPCKASLPALNEFRRSHQGKGVEVLSVNLGEPAAAVNDFVTREGYSLWVLLDSDSSVAGAYGVQGIPTLVVIDKNGNVRQKFVGYDPQLESKLEETIAAL